jgi:hypothetical protein
LGNLKYLSMPNNKITYWIMQNGEKINVDDMTESHLRNVLKLILRNTEKRKFKLNGDMANEFNESNLSDENDNRFDEASEVDIY